MSGAYCGQRTQEEVVRVWAWSSDLEDFHHVEELAMDIADDCHRRSNVHNIALLHEELFRLCAYCLDHRLGQQLLLGESRYALIEIYGSCV